MTKMLLGSMMGFALGVGMMMSPAGRTIRRDVHHGVSCLRRWMRDF